MLNKHGIESVVFDLGGVVINLNRDAAVHRLEELGLTTAGKYLDLYCQSGPFLDLETGKITAAQFYDLIRNEINNDVTDLQIQQAFNAFLTDLPVERLHTISKLREAGYKVLALSNTNPVMYHSWIANAFAQEGKRINDYFDGVLASFEEGCCKPDPKIFHTLISRYRLNPANTLYLDDGPANCRAAAQTGLQTMHVTADKPMTLLNDYLL
ncbi:MAG: HAD family phosphatase [Prevotella sp.]|nr:HAD family phosphatase [Bacteroides sp.]MCM1365755.1 HAD family phosphatase [Prevotella sp.]MCM1436425.1 HAD family phosphatase [Prevotella sp.]